MFLKITRFDYVHWCAYSLRFGAFCWRMADIGPHNDQAVELEKHRVASSSAVTFVCVVSKK